MKNTKLYSILLTEEELRLFSEYESQKKSNERGKKVDEKKPQKPENYKDLVKERDSNTQKAVTECLIAAPGSYVVSRGFLTDRAGKIERDLRGKVVGRIEELGERATRGDRSASEFILKANSDRAKFSKLIDKGISTNPKLKRVKTAAAVIPAVIGGGFIASSYAHARKADKLNEQIDEIDSKYKKDLKEWKKNNK